MFISEAYAQAATAATPSPIITMLVPMAIVFTIFYFLVIRPQNKRLQEHKNKIDAVKRGDDVLIAGGIFGKVAHIREDKIEVEIAPNVRIKVLKSGISDILTKEQAVTV